MDRSGNWIGWPQIPIQLLHCNANFSKSYDFPCLSFLPEIYITLMSDIQGRLEGSVVLEECQSYRRHYIVPATNEQRCKVPLKSIGYRQELDTGSS
jgi:hypothetical protein